MGKSTGTTKPTPGVCTDARAGGRDAAHRTLDATIAELASARGECQHGEREYDRVPDGEVEVVDVVDAVGEEAREREQLAYRGPREGAHQPHKGGVRRREAHAEDVARRGQNLIRRPYYLGQG